MPPTNPEKRYRRISLDTTYKLISSGYRQAIAKTKAGDWRVASTSSPATDDYVSVAAGERHPIVSDGETYARMETGTGCVEVTYL